MGEGDKRPGNDGGRAPRRALIVEPDKLLRWSLSTFLSKWFEIDATANPELAVPFLSRHRFDVAILSHDESTSSFETLQRRLIAENPMVVTVRIVTTRDETPGSDCVKTIEKPFDLATLANLLNLDPVIA